MHILYPSRRDLRRTLRDTGTGSQDFVIVITGALRHTEVTALKDDLEEFVRVLRNGGLMFVQGCPRYTERCFCSARVITGLTLSAHALRIRTVVSVAGR